jgi:hypothetical protein
MDFIRVPQPPYSLDVAPSDFVLFVFLKERLDGTTFSKETDLILAVRPILTQISLPTIAAVMDNWIHCLHRVIELDGDYFHSFHYNNTLIVDNRR